MGRSICHWPPYNKQKNPQKFFYKSRKVAHSSNSMNSGMKNLLQKVPTEEDFSAMSLDFLKLHFSTKYHRSCESVLRVKVQKKVSVWRPQRLVSALRNENLSTSYPEFHGLSSDVFGWSLTSFPVS